MLTHLPLTFLRDKISRQFSVMEQQSRVHTDLDDDLVPVLMTVRGKDGEHWVNFGTVLRRQQEQEGI